MMPVNTTTLLVLLLAICGCGSDERVPTLFGGPTAVDTVRAATSVQVYRIDDTSSIHADLSDYTMTAGPIAVPAGDAAKLGELLTNPNSYEWHLETAKGCDVTYGVRVRFQRGSDQVDLLFCLWCAEELIFWNGKQVGLRAFDRIHQEVLAILLPLFPNDTSIQELQSKLR